MSVFNFKKPLDKNGLIVYNQPIPLTGIEYRRFYMKQCMDVDAINKRLKKIEGQVRGISKMVNDDKPCEDILIQIGAIKSALHKTGQLILEGHMHHCVLDGISSGKEDETINKLISALNQFSKTI